jgi:hypothetical protein
MLYRNLLGFRQNSRLFSRCSSNGAFFALDLSNIVASIVFSEDAAGMSYPVAKLAFRLLGERGANQFPHAMKIKRCVVCPGNCLKKLRGKRARRKSFRLRSFRFENSLKIFISVRLQIQRPFVASGGLEQAMPAFLASPSIQSSKAASP